MIYRLMFDHRVRLALWAMLLIASVVLAACGPSGTYQGGGDSVPHYR